MLTLAGRQMIGTKNQQECLAMCWEAEYKYETKFTFKRELQIYVVELILMYLLIERIIIYCIAVNFNNCCRLRTKGDISKIVYGWKIGSEVY